MKALLTAGMATAALSTGACVEALGVANLAKPARTPGEAASAASRPARASPAPASPRPSDEASFTFVLGKGLVRGDRAALASFGAPLVAKPGPNLAVDACRDVVQAEAIRSGATEVEAVSGGPQRIERSGRIVAPVEFRVTYAVTGGYEVKLSTLTCIIDAQGRLLDAFPPKS